MDETEFSKGPWKVNHEVDRDGLHIFWIDTEHESTVAKCFNPDNAKLIAAAPDMYEALKEIVDLFDGLMHGGFQKLELFTLKPARLALAKAQGGDPS